MKRTILFFLTLASVLLFQNVGFAYYRDVTDTDYEKSVNVLSSIGILNGYEDGTFKPEKEVTRAEFVSAMMGFLNQKGMGSTELTYYSDVPKDYWALSDINAATSTGIINGSDDGNFYPDSNITITDAAKIVVSALGYEPLAAEKNGYPAGYIKVASGLDILDNVKTDINSSAKRGDMALMLYNALEVKMIVQTNKGYEKSNETVLSSIHKIEKRTGTVNATRYAKMIPVENLDDDEIMIDSVRYKITDPFLHELVGYKISFYTKEVDDKHTVLYYEISHQNGKSAMIWAEQLLDQSDDSHLIYEDDKGKKITAKIDAEFVMVNGQSVKYTGADMFNIDEGGILIIDTNDDGQYETIFINEPKTIVVDRVDKTAEVVYYKYSGSQYLDFKNKEVDIYKADEKIELSELKEWDVLTVYERPDQESVLIYASDQTASVTIESISSSSDKYELSVSGGEIYKLGYRYRTLLDDGTQGAVMPKCGQKVQLYLDVNGDVAAIYSSQNAEGEYALLIQCSLDGRGDAAVRIMTESGEVKILKCADKVTVDNGSEIVKYTEYDKLIAELKRTTLPDENNSFGDKIFQLIQYRTNAEGDINKIFTAERLADYSPIRNPNTFTLDFYSEKAISNGNDVFNGAYRAKQGDVKIFYVPNDLNEYSKYTNKVSMAEKTKYKCALYDMDEHNNVAAALIFQPANDNVSIDVQYNPYFTVDETAEALDDEENIISRVYGMYNRKMTTVDFDKNQGFNKGDVYQFGYLDGKPVIKQKIYDAEIDAYTGSGAAEPGKLTGSGPATDEVMRAYLKVKDITDSSIIVTDGEKEWLLFLSSSQTRCTLVDLGTNAKADVRNADISEIHVGDRVVVRTYKLTLGDVVIIRQ